MERVGRLRPGELRVHVERVESTWTIALVGELDRLTVPELRNAVERVAAHARSPVVLDLTGCSFLDAAGLDALDAADTVLRASGEPVRLLAPPFVARLLELAGLDARFVVTVAKLDGAAESPQPPRPVSTEG